MRNNSFSFLKVKPRFKWNPDTIADNALSIQNYQLMRKDRTYAQHGGVALYVKESIKLDRLYEYEHTSNDHIEVLCRDVTRTLIGGGGGGGVNYDHMPSSPRILRTSCRGTISSTKFK